MRIRKGREEKWKGPGFPPKMSLNKYAELKSLHLFNLISLFLFPSLQSQHPLCHFIFSSWRVPLDSDRLFFFFSFFLIPRSWSPQCPDSGALSASIHPYLGKSQGWRLSVGHGLQKLKSGYLVRWVEDSFRAKGLGAQLKAGVLLIHAVSGDNE